MTSIMLPRLWLVLICGIGLSSCASSPGETHYYLLATPAPAGTQVTAEALVTVNRVILPTYLDRMGIVLVSEDRQVQVANYHLWAEPLNESISKILHDQLLDNWQAGASDLTIDVLFFHGNLSGLVVLDVNWTAQLSCGEAVRARFRDSLQQPTSGYLALVETHVELLQNLATQIGNVVGRRSTCSA